MKKGFVLVLGTLAVGGCDQLVDQQMSDIHDKVARDAVEQYDIAKRQGDPIQTCVQAGIVSAAYLQAKDEGSYNTWKAIERADCARAGLPR